MKKPITTFIFILLVDLLHAQNPLIKQWDYRYGGSNYDWLTTFQNTKDSGFILGGFSYSGISGDKTQDTIGDWDYWIVKIDSLGQKEWDKDFGGTKYDPLTSLQPTKDGGYILGGWSQSDSSGDKTQPSQGIGDYWIVKTDSFGNKQWDKDFGGTGSDELMSILQCADGGYLFGGRSTSDSSGDKTQASYGFEDYWIVKTDSLGNKQWDKDFGGTGSDVLYSLQQTTDNGYILGGYSSSPISGNKTEPYFGSYDYWVVKTDSLGVKQWDKDFGGTDIDLLYSIKQTTDVGYILGGVSYSNIGGNKTSTLWGGVLTDYWIIKIDSLGNNQWQKNFGGTAGEDEFCNILLTIDGGYLFVGTSYSSISGDKTEDNLSNEQGWIMKTDSFGNKQWDKTLFTLGHDESCFAVQTKDGCYTFANFDDGGIGGYRTQASRGTYDYWITKFCPQCNLTSPVLTQSGDTLSVPSVYTTYQWFHDSIPIGGATQNYYVAIASGNYNLVVTDTNGCSVGAGIINVIAGIESIYKKGEFRIFPNPITNTFIIKNISSNEQSLLQVMNPLGEIIYSVKLFEKNEYKVDANFAKGIYYVRVNNVVRKLIVE